MPVVVVQWSDTTKQTIFDITFYSSPLSWKQVLSSFEDKTVSVVALRTVKCLKDRTSCCCIFGCWGWDGGWVLKINKQNKMVESQLRQVLNKSMAGTTSQITTNGFVQNYFLIVFVNILLLF